MAVLREWARAFQPQTPPESAQVELPLEVPKEPPETYDQRWLRILSGEDALKAHRIKDLPLFGLALHGIKAFNPPNGNKGRSNAERKNKQ